MTTPEGTRVLAIDPGVKTGIALLVDGRVAATSIACAPWDGLRNAIRLMDATDVVCESGPVFSRHHRAVLEEVERVVREEAEDVQWVQPAQWKNTPASRGENPTGISVHEKDACAIARWYYHAKGATRVEGSHTT